MGNWEGGAKKKEKANVASTFFAITPYHLDKQNKGLRTRFLTPPLVKGETGRLKKRQEKGAETTSPPIRNKQNKESQIRKETCLPKLVLGYPVGRWGAASQKKNHRNWGEAKGQRGGLW